MTNLTEKSYTLIRQALLSDQVSEAKRFSISELSQRLGIGRSPVRDAVNRLAAEGILQSVAKSGIVVRVASFAELQDIVGLREALETYAVVRACATMDYAQRRQLHALCLKMKGLARRIRATRFTDEALHRDMQRADWGFHQLILEAADNSIMQKIIEDHHLLLRKVRYPSLPTVRHLALTLLEHWRICRAIERDDAEAAHLWMLRHARRGGKAMLESWRRTAMVPDEKLKS